MATPHADSLTAQAVAILAAEPDRAFTVADVATVIDPGFDRATDAGKRLHRQINMALHNANQGVKHPVVRVDTGLYRYSDEPKEPRPPKAKMTRATPPAEWQPVPLTEDEVSRELVEALIKADVLGRSRDGNWIVRDPEDRFWEIKLNVDGRLL